MSQGMHLFKKVSPKTTEEMNRMSSILYASAVGSIMYAIYVPGLMLLMAQAQLVDFKLIQESIFEKQLKNILKYLRRTKDIFLVYDGSDLKLEEYSDSNF